MLHSDFSQRHHFGLETQLEDIPIVVLLVHETCNYMTSQPSRHYNAPCSEEYPQIDRGLNRHLDPRPAAQWRGTMPWKLNGFEWVAPLPAGREARYLTMPECPQSPLKHHCHGENQGKPYLGSQIEAAKLTVFTNLPGEKSHH